MAGLLAGLLLLLSTALIRAYGPPRLSAEVVHRRFYLRRNIPERDAAVVPPNEVQRPRQVTRKKRVRTATTRVPRPLPESKRESQVAVPKVVGEAQASVTAAPVRMPAPHPSPAPAPAEQAALNDAQDEVSLPDVIEPALEARQPVLTDHVRSRIVEDGEESEDGWGDDWEDAQAPPPQEALSPTVCEVAYWQGYRKSAFYARAFDDHGLEVALAESPQFKATGNGTPDQTEAAIRAHERLLELLQADGWKPIDAHASAWYECMLERADGD